MTKRKKHCVAARPSTTSLQDEVTEKINRARYTPEDEFEAYKENVLGELENAFAVAA